MALKWNRHNGNWLISASRDHFCKLFDIRNLKEEVQCFRGHKKEACSKLCFFTSCIDFNFFIFLMTIKVNRIKRTRRWARISACHYFFEINQINLFDISYEREDVLVMISFRRNRYVQSTNIPFSSSFGLASDS